MDALHANLFTAFNIYVEVVDEDRLVRPHPGSLESDLEDLRFGFGHTDLRRDDDVVERVLHFFAADEITQIVPGIRDHSRNIFAAQGTKEVQELTIDDV